jgi:hypothetical protein
MRDDKHLPCILPPLGFNDWVKQFPVSQENKKLAEEILKWLKENNKPVKTLHGI